MFLFLRTVDYFLSVIRCFILVFILFSMSFGHAQNLEKIGTKEMMKISGGLAFNTITYMSDGVNFPSREPFTWYASGNVNISLLDVSLPFSYTYSNQGGKFTQPFNRTSLNPSYKWVKSTIGLTSLNFSPYTLTGHLFLGAGVELTPGKWKISAMAGRLNKAVPYSSIENNINQFTFGRFGYGLKLAYEDKGFGGSLIFFKAKDNPESIPFIPLNSGIDPQDNFVVSAGGKAKISNFLFLEMEYALSALTQNIMHSESSEASSGLSFLYPLVSANASTSFFQAYKSSLKYQWKWMNIGFNFEHIDPGYKTLGGYFFNNDLNNFTLSPAFSLFKKKLNISGNTGFQKNNLGGDKSATTTRWVGSVNASFVPSQKLILNGSFSNFSTFTKNRPITDPFYFAPADTMNFYQLTKSASAMVSYSMGEGEKRSALQLMYNFQQSTNLTGNINQPGFFGSSLPTEETGAPMLVHMTNLAFNKPLKSIAANLTFAANMNRTFSANSTHTFFGPTVNFQKSLFQKKSNLAVGSTYNRQYSEEALTNHVFNHRLSFTYAPKFEKEESGKMNLSLNANWMQKLATDSMSPSIQEVNIFINLNYSF